MKVLGIVAEYNPFHNGHLYQIQKAKEITKSDYVVVVMSGSFTQQGNIAIYDKFKRAKLAVENGADLVIELPTIYAVSSAEYFAYGAVNLLDKLGVVDYICFGAEEPDISKLEHIADVIIQNEKDIWAQIRSKSSSGDTFAKNRNEVLKSYLDGSYIDMLSKSNNILGIEYIKSLKKLNSKIKPYCVKRLNSEYSEERLNSNSLGFTSATSIRRSVSKNTMAILKDYVPQNTFDIIQNENPTFNSKIFDLIKYKVLSANRSELKEINEITEGLENAIIRAINVSKSYEKLVENIKSKRYVESKIRRILINLLLSITKHTFAFAIENRVAYAHILACSDAKATLLSKLSKHSSIPVITSLSEENLESIEDMGVKDLLKIDILGTNIYNSVNNTNTYTDFTNRL